MGWDAPTEDRVSKMINSSYQVFDAIVKCRSMEVGAAFRITDQSVTEYIALAQERS